MKFQGHLRRARHLTCEFSRSVLSLALCAFLAGGGCIPTVPPSPEPLSGLRDYQVAAFAEVPGGLVNTNGGNLFIQRVDLSLPTALQVPEEIRGTYNSASGEWLFPFEMTYDGSTFVDHTGAVYDVSGLADGQTIPGSYWVKVDSTRVMTKGELVHEFDGSGALMEKYWLGQICPWIEYIPAPSSLQIQQWDCGGGPEWRAFTRLLYTVTYDANGRVASVDDGIGGRTALYTYDVSGRLETARDGLDVEKGWPGFRYEYSGSNLTAITNSEGERIEYEYYAPRPGGTDRLQYVTRIGEGNPQYSLVYYAKNMHGLYTTVLTNPLGEKTRYRFDEARRLYEIEYDAVGEEVLFGYGLTLRPTSITSANGVATHYTYIGDDVETVTLPSGNVVTYAYADANNKASPLTRATARIEDSLGLVEERIYTVDDPVDQRRLASVSNGEGETVSYEWGEHGGFTRLASVTDAYGIQKSFSKYHSLGQPTKVTQGGAIGLAAFDDAGNRTQGRDGVPELGGILQRSFDPDGNPDRVTVAPIGPDGNVGGEADIELSYRSDHRVVYVSRPGGADHRFTYDALGRNVAREERADGVWQTTFFEYDPIGRMIATERPNGMREEREFDQRNRLRKRRVYRDGFLEGEAEYTYQDGVLWSIFDSIQNGTESYSYDFAGRLRTIQYVHGETLTYGYDLRDRIVSETYKWPDGSVVKEIEYRYDLADRKTQVYDGDVGSGGELVLDYDYQDGKLVSVEYGNGLRRTFSYDPDLGVRDGAITRDLTTGEIIETTDLSFELLEDPAVWEIGSSTTVDSAITGTVTESYLIGPAMVEDDSDPSVGQRVFDWEGTSGTKAYAYDALSNRVSADGDWFSYNAEGNRLLGATVDGGTLDYTYDEAGFVTSRNGVPITWAATGQISSFGDVTFEWDMRGRLLFSGETGVLRDWSWFGGNIEVNEAGAPLVLDLLGVVLNLQTAERFYRHSDFRKNVQFVSDENGEIVTLHGYRPYGIDVTLGDPGDGVHFGGRQGIGELMLLGARVYDPVVGRFLSPDPVFSLLNQYTYTFGNPVWFSDRDGLWTAVEWTVAGLALGYGSSVAAGVGFLMVLGTAPVSLTVLAGVGFALSLGSLIAGVAAVQAGFPGGAGSGGSPAGTGGYGKHIHMYIEPSFTAEGGGGAPAGADTAKGAGGDGGGGNSSAAMSATGPGQSGANSGEFGEGGGFGGGGSASSVGVIGGIGCGIGFELVFLLPLLMSLNSRRRRK